MAIAIVFFILVITLMLAFYMNKREVFRRKQEHEHRADRFNRLMEQLKKMQSTTNTKPGANTDDSRKQNSDL